ncbi:LPS biosynthesis RfbU related protein [Nitrospira sp.]|nr:LPS biosynthesis RfbU related protein [Nitrospira sp.]
MNILFITPFFTPQTGGVATFLEDARRFLGERGHGVYVLRLGDARRIEQCAQNQDERVYELYLRSPFVPEAPLRSVLAFAVYVIPTLWRLGKFLRQKRIDVMSVEYPLAFALYFSILRALTGTKMVVGLHGDDVLSIGKLPAYERAIVKHIVRTADWLLTHSASLMGQTERIVGSLRERRSYLPYGIDCERLRARAEQVSAPAKLVGGAYVLTVAKLYDRKGIDVLLRALRKVRDVVGSIRFLIVGDGPEEAKLKSMAEDLGVIPYVVFAGDVPNSQIPALFRDCRFFVLPSRSEPFGIVLLEAMTFGKAILATRVGGIPEFVTDGANGVLVPSEDADALADRLREFLSDSSYLERIGKNGLAVAENVYDYRVVIKKYEELYARMVAEGAIRRAA